MSENERAERFRPNMRSLITLSLIALIVGGNAIWTFARHSLTSSPVNSAGAAGGVAGALFGGILCIGLMAYAVGLAGFYIFAARIVQATRPSLGCLSCTSLGW